MGRRRESDSLRNTENKKRAPDFAASMLYRVQCITASVGGTETDATICAENRREKLRLPFNCSLCRERAPNVRRHTVEWQGNAPCWLTCINEIPVSGSRKLATDGWC
jgi:hypothetical protein